MRFKCGVIIRFPDDWGHGRLDIEVEAPYRGEAVRKVYALEPDVVEALKKAHEILAYEILKKEVSIAYVVCEEAE